MSNMPRVALQVVSWIALIGTILPSVLFLTDRMSLDASKGWLLGATIAWFIATPLWMGREKQLV
jgi:hypothetical protein